MVTEEQHLDTEVKLRRSLLSAEKWLSKNNVLTSKIISS